MPSGREIADTLRAGEVVGEVTVTVTEVMVDAYTAAVGDFSPNQDAEKTTVGTASAYITGGEQESQR